MKTVSRFTSSRLGFAGLLALACTAWGQAGANKGELAGAVTGAFGSEIAGARIQLRSLRTGAVREQTANAAGTFRVLLVDPGDYTLTVTQDGFAPVSFHDISIGAGARLYLRAVLVPGDTARRASYQMNPDFDFGLNVPTTAVRRSRLADLPINGRRFHDFALLAPTVQTDPDRGQLSFAGQRGVNANVMIDGVDYNSPFLGGIRGGDRSNFALTVPQSAVDEFQVVITGYSAEYGRSTGGVLNAVTRSGSNETHGSAFYQMRHKESGLQTPFRRQILETQHQFGADAGGALRRDSLFWFSAYEQQNARTPRHIFFGALANYQPVNATRDAYEFLKSKEGPFDSTNNALATLHRLDRIAPDGSRLTIRYNFSNAIARNAASIGGPTEVLTTNTLSANGDERDRTHSGVLQHTSLFSPVSANDLRFSTTYELRPRTSNSAKPGVSSVIGQFGSRNFLPNMQSDMRVQFADSLSLSRGAHSLKIGIDYNWLTAGQTFGNNRYGFFNFTTSNLTDILSLLSATGSGANRMDSPLVTYQLQVGNLASDLRMHQVALFAHDSWRPFLRFTIDYGIRWEGQFNPGAEANNDKLAGLLRSAPLPIGQALDPARIPDQPANWMPRAGFTWSPFASGRTVVRGHAGLFYASTPMVLLADPVNNFRLPPGNVSIALPVGGSTVYRDLLRIGIDLNRYPLDGLPVLTPEQIQQAAGGVDPYSNARLTVMASDFRNPRSIQTGLGFTHQLTSRWTVEGQLHLINTVFLHRNRDYNLPAPRLLPTDQSLRPNYGLTAMGANRVARPIPTLDRLTVRESNARSLYQAATVSAGYRRGRLQIAGHYTWSKNFSDDDNERATTALAYDNAFDLRPEYGYARIDFRHQFTGSAYYSLPWKIDVSSILRARSGAPIDPLTGVDSNQDGSMSDRAYRAPGVPFPRNSFRNYYFRNIDVRFLKSFPFGETKILQFSCEMFNVANFHNVVIAGRNLNYGAGVDSFSGGPIAPLATFKRLRLPDGTYDPVNTQVGTPFQAQFGLRFRF